MSDKTRIGGRSCRVCTEWDICKHHIDPEEDLKELAEGCARYQREYVEVTPDAILQEKRTLYKI